MDYDEIKQTRVVHAETFDAFEREYNRAMCELSGCEVHDDDVHYCIECPFLEDPHDNRRMWCRCSHQTMRTRKDSEACPYFYRELTQGKIEPVER